MKPFSRHLEESGMSVAHLVSATGLEARVVKAIADGRYTPSPSDRQRLADAIGVDASEISWEHAAPVEHLRGNGPQCGRNT